MNVYRIQRFDLREFVNSFVFSSLTCVGKPDTDIYRLALDMPQVPAGQAVGIDSQLLFFEVATGLEIKCIRHTETRPTGAELAALGSQIYQDGFHAN